MTTDIEELAKRIETAETFDDAASGAAIKVLSEYAAKGKFDLQDTDRLSTEETIHLIDRLVPGWTIHIEGQAMEPNGHWHCQLRRSAIRDNDEFVGMGRGRHLQNAMVAALLRTLDYLIGRAALT